MAWEQANEAKIARKKKRKKKLIPTKIAEYCACKIWFKLQEERLNKSGTC